MRETAEFKRFDTFAKEVSSGWKLKFSKKEEGVADLPLIYVSDTKDKFTVEIYRTPPMLWRTGRTRNDSGMIQLFHPDINGSFEAFFLMIMLFHLRKAKKAGKGFDESFFYADNTAINYCVKNFAEAMAIIDLYYIMAHFTQSELNKKRKVKVVELLDKLKKKGKIS